MPGVVHPHSRARPTSSPAERELWRALQRELPEGGIAWHSLRLRVQQRWEGEGDFVIAIPDRGLIVIEVKGGAITLEDGLWRQNGKEMKPPRDQAHTFARNLASKLAGAGRRVPFVIACAFADCDFSAPPTNGDLQGLVIGRRELRFLGKSLEAIARRELPEPPRGPLPDGWMRRLHELWGESWVPTVHLSDQVKDVEHRRVALNEEQFRILEVAGENPSALVEGGAGTGKTVVAQELASRRAAAGEDVLFLCFTEKTGPSPTRSPQGCPGSRGRSSGWRSASFAPCRADCSRGI